MTSLAGFQAGDPVSWQHRLTVRKVKGAAAVAWEEWRDCAEHVAACKAGQATGGGWTSPSWVLLVTDPKGTVHGIGAGGTLKLTPGESAMSGMTAVMIGAGQQQDTLATRAPATTGSVNARSTPGFGPVCISPTGETPYAVSGMVAATGYTNLPGFVQDGLH